MFREEIDGVFFVFFLELRTGFVSKEMSGWWHLVQLCLSYKLWNRIGSGFFFPQMEIQRKI